MTSTKFCRISSDCGPQSQCRGNLFGLIRSKCISTKGACRLDSSCPKYYQCVGNEEGLSSGKCLLAISKSNPISKAFGNISSALLDPAAVYRRTHVVNLMPIVMISAILLTIGYYVYEIFIKPYPKSQLGTCFTSIDCELPNAGTPLEFQCGKRIYNTQKPPTIASVKGGICDCKHIQGGGNLSSGAQWLQPGRPSPKTDKYKWLFRCQCDDIAGGDWDQEPGVLSTDYNCTKCWCKNEFGKKFLAPVLVNTHK